MYRKWFAITEYDKYHEPIYTTLYKYGKDVFTVAGWYNTDDMVKLYLKNRKGSV